MYSSKRLPIPASLVSQVWLYVSVLIMRCKRKYCGNFQEILKRNVQLFVPSSFLLSFFFFFFSFFNLFFNLLFRAVPAAYGNSQARGQIGAAAASLRYSHSNTGSKRICDLHHSSQQCQILKPLSEARDRTWVPMDTCRIHFPWATGTLFLLSWNADLGPGAPATIWNMTWRS